MTQHDYVIANQALNAGRTDINNALASIQSVNSGSSAPTSTVAYMQWLDTTNSLLKMRNSADNAWLSILKSDGVQQYASGSTAALPAFSTDGDPNTGAFFPAADTWAISTGGYERFRVDSSGNVGFGTTTANSIAHFAKSVTANNDTSLMLSFENTSGGLYDWEVGPQIIGGNATFSIRGGANGFGSLTNLFKIYSSGHAFFPSLATSGTDNGSIKYNSTTGEIWKDGSSIRYKENIQDLNINPSLLCDLRSVSYNRKGVPFRKIGFIAEEVFDIFPELVGIDKDGIPDSISYEYFVVPLIAGYKQHDSEMKKLRDRIAVLEG